jgi:hypothetical protein
MNSRCHHKLTLLLFSKIKIFLLFARMKVIGKLFFGGNIILWNSFGQYFILKGFYKLHCALKESIFCRKYLFHRERFAKRGGG